MVAKTAGDLPLAPADGDPCSLGAGTPDLGAVSPLSRAAEGEEGVAPDGELRVFSTPAETGLPLGVLGLPPEPPGAFSKGADGGLPSATLFAALGAEKSFPGAIATPSRFSEAAPRLWLADTSLTRVPQAPPRTATNTSTGRPVDTCVHRERLAASNLTPQSSEVHSLNPPRGRWDTFNGFSGEKSNR